MTQNEMLKLAIEIGYQQALDEVGFEKVALPAALEGVLRAPGEWFPGMAERLRGLLRSRTVARAPAPRLAPPGPSEFARYQAMQTPESIGFQRLHTAPADAERMLRNAPPASAIPHETSLNLPAEIPGRVPVQTGGRVPAPEQAPMVPSVLEPARPIPRRQAPVYASTATPQQVAAMPSLAPATTAGGQLAPVREAPRATAATPSQGKKLQAPTAEEEAARARQAEGWRWSESAAPRPAPVARRQAPTYERPGMQAELKAMPSLAPATTASGQLVPVREPPLSPARPKKTKAKAPAPAPEAPPPAPAPAAAPAPVAAPAGEAAAAPPMTNAEVAQQMQQARQIQDPVAYTQRMQELEKGYGKQVGEIAGQGAVSPLLSWAAPMALATGGGYMLGGQEGAATGAGLALGTRLGAGPALKRIAESRGIAKTLGHAMPTLGESVKALPQGELAKAVALGGGLGLGGGVAGHYIGKEKPKEPWYNQLMGLTPAIASAAVPYMMMKGTNPQLISQLQQLQSLQPAMPMEGQMQQGM